VPTTIPTEGSVSGDPYPGAFAALSPSDQAAFACIRQAESGDTYTDDTGNGYYGAYQFMEGTWLGIGESGYPNGAAPVVQDDGAAALMERSGWGQWSTATGCGR
jgi:hypothetical protein